MQYVIYVLIKYVLIKPGVLHRLVLGGIATVATELTELELKRPGLGIVRLFIGVCFGVAIFNCRSRPAR